MKVESKPVGGNHTRGRGGMRPDVIVIHIQEGTMSGTDAWFRNPESKVSAHYGVGKDGSVVQWVADANQAWHAGTVNKPTAELVKDRPALNPNKYTLGIECEGKATDEPTLHLLTALGELVRQLCGTHGIPITRKHIIGHREIRADKTCPGKIDVDQVVAIARSGAPEQESPTIADDLDEIERRARNIRDKL